MGTRIGPAARGRGIRYTLVALVALGACDSDPAGPGPGPDAVDLRVMGAAINYSGGTAQLAGEQIQLVDGIDGLQGSFHGATRRVGTLVLDLWKGDSISNGSQSTRSFDRFEFAVDFEAGAHEVDLTTTPAMSMLRLSIPDFDVEMVDDPCVLDVRLLTQAPKARSDRFIYQGSFQNIVAGAFVHDDDYQGGNVFDDGDPRTTYVTACQTDVWDLSDAIVCGGDDDRTHCVYHLWGDAIGLTEARGRRRPPMR